MILAVHQKRVIETLASMFPMGDIIDMLRSVAGDLPPGDHRAAIVEEATRRLGLVAAATSAAWPKSFGRMT